MAADTSRFKARRVWQFDLPALRAFILLDPLLVIPHTSSMSRRKSPKRWIIRFTAAVLFVALAYVLVASANGLLFNFQSGTFQQTAIINITTKQTPVTIQINGEKELYKKSPINLAYLFPGLYDVTVEKPNYFSWSKTIHVSAGEAVVNPFVELFLFDSAALPATATERLTVEKEVLVPFLDSDLDVRGNEIWAKQIARTYPVTVVDNQYTLVGRFVSSVPRAVWLPGKTHIIFQLDNEIHIMDRDGTNDHTLVTLSSDSPTLFVTTGNKEALLYQDGESFYRRPLQ